MLKNILKAEIFIILFLIISSCSENPPEISQVFWQLNRFNDIEAGEVYDTLSLFIQVSDPDGIEDIASVYLINDSNELFWKIDEDKRVIKENQGVNWIGSNRLQMNDNSSFPSGEYRVLVLDEAGERIESSFTIKNNSSAPEKEIFPDMNIRADNITADSNTDVIWTYKSDGTVLTENYIDGNNNTFPLIENSSETYLYKYDKINGNGLVSGPYSVIK